LRSVIRVTVRANRFALGDGRRRGRFARVSVPASQNKRVPRKRRARKVGIFLAGCVAGGAVVVGLLLAPPVQGWVLRKVVGMQPGWRVSFERFGAAPTGVEARGLEFAMPGVVARMEPLIVRIAPGRLLTKRELQIERVEAQKVRVTITPAELAASESAPFTGVLSLLQSPLPWMIDEVKLEGEIAVRDGEAAVVVGTFRIEGGGLSATTPGEFSYEIAVNSALLPLGPENKVRSSGTVRLTQTATHGVARIEVSGSLALPKYGGLELPEGTFSMAVAASEKGEDYGGRLELGEAVSAELKAALDGALGMLGGRVGWSVKDGLLVSGALGEPMPRVTTEAEAVFSIDANRGEVTAALGGEVVAEDFGRWMPELGVVGAFRGRFDADVSRRAAAVSLESFTVAMRGEPADDGDAPVVRVALDAPVNVLEIPDTRVATVTLEKIPATWANPWLASTEVELEPAEFGGAWSLALADGAERVVLTAVRACVVEPVVFKGLPLPPGRFSFSPRLELTSAGVRVDVADFWAVSEAGERMRGRAGVTYDFATEAIGLEGEMSGKVPTVPFSVTARWAGTMTGDVLELRTLELEGREKGREERPIEAKLLDAVAVNLETLNVPEVEEARELLRLKFDGLELGWVSQWLSDAAVEGSLARGESVMSVAAGGKLSLTTKEAWEVTGAKLAVGGREMVEGRVAFSPGVEFSEDRIEAKVSRIEGLDSRGNRVHGDVAVSAQIAEKRAAVELELEAELPSLPGSEGTFGAVTATVTAKAHNETETLVAMDEFALRVRNAERELVGVVAPEPFVFGLANSGAAVLATLEPLRVSVGEMPLAWAEPWVAPMGLDGVLEPCEFAVTAKMTKFLVRPLTPVSVRGLAVRNETGELVRDAAFSFFPGLDLTLICMPVPEFVLAMQGHVHVTNGALEVAGKRALDVDAAVRFLGNDRTVLPSGVEMTTRAELSALAEVPAVKASGAPGSGSVVTRVNGDLLGQAPIEFWTRIEGVRSADGTRVLPAVEVESHGKVSPSDGFFGDVAVSMETQPRVTDARFEVHLNPTDAMLHVASGFRSRFFDAGEALEWAKVFQPANLETVVAADAGPDAKSGSGARTYSQMGVPFWSVVRGHFDLELGAVQSGPYRIDELRGRLELRDREVELKDLRGTMFAGRWGGNVRIDYRPEDKEADHALTGEFRIEQFDSSRVVQTVFPEELSSVDAKIDVRSTVRSRGNALPELIERTAGEFTVEGREGVVRLKVPKQELAATAAVFGGTILLSPELRALGRLLKKFAEMPVDEIRISGERTEGGEVALKELRIESPQAKLVAKGRIPAVEGEPLMNRPLELSIDLAAKDEMAVILGGMSLIEKKPRADGYRGLKETFVLGGKAGEPDTGPLYDLLAKAVVGSKGTWGFLMRKVQNEVNKMKAKEEAAAAKGARKTAMISR